MYRDVRVNGAGRAVGEGGALRHAGQEGDGVRGDQDSRRVSLAKSPRAVVPVLLPPAGQALIKIKNVECAVATMIVDCVDKSGASHVRIYSAIMFWNVIQQWGGGADRASQGNKVC